MNEFESHDHIPVATKKPALRTDKHSSNAGFTLSTEQHEILMAFEEAATLNEVARKVRRDPSVVSRTLKSIAETAPLLEKHMGKWKITPLGRQFNRLTKNFLQTQTKLLNQGSSLRLAPAMFPAIGKGSALLLLGTQNGFLNPVWGPRNNPDAEAKMETLLSVWRRRKDPVIFCQHLSKKKGSPLSPGTAGSDFIPSLTPKSGEKIIKKSHNSAFVKSELECYLKKKSIQNVIIVGFTTAHCVDATARSAFDCGFNVYVISDAVSTFDRIGPDGKYYSAEILHASTLTALHQEYATIIDSDLFISSFFEMTSQF